LSLHANRFASHPYELRKCRHLSSLVYLRIPFALQRGETRFLRSRTIQTSGSRQARTLLRESALTRLKVYCESGATTSQNSARTPRVGISLCASLRRGLLGLAGLASHSGRSSVPFRLALFRDRRFPFQPNSCGRQNRNRPLLHG